MTDNNTGPEKVPFVLSEKIYNPLKFLALVLLPALTTLYFTLGGLWHLPNVEQVIGTMTAVDTFLGVILGISTRLYNATNEKYVGDIVLTNHQDGKKTFSLDLNGDPSDLANKNEVTFKIRTNPDIPQ